MTPDFSISELMHEPYESVVQEKTIYSDSMNLKMFLHAEYYCDNVNIDSDYCNVRKDDYYRKTISAINSTGENEIAA